MELLDTTLREINYLINFQLTAEETARVCAQLEDAGVSTIEIGHGLGLGASSPQYGIAAGTDKDHLKAASSVLTNARICAFFIPGIGTKEDIELAKDCGLRLLRIGTNVSQYESAREFILFAKKLGLQVSFNFMKSYVATPQELLQKAKEVVHWGADIVVVVDSAGCLLPTEVREYVAPLSEHLESVVGFHGHNNLQLAVGNSLAAVEGGATVIDCALRGIGRSAGNAQTEIMVMILEKLGLNTRIDMFKILDAGESVATLVPSGSGVPALDAIMGHAGIHSGFLKNISAASQSHGVDPRALIVEVSKVNKENPALSLMMELAEKLAAKCGETEATS